MNSSNLSAQPLPGAARSCRVAIAGTITNAATGEIVPLATVRITAAPVAFGEGLLATVAAAAARCPLLGDSYRTLLAQRGQRADPLATAQFLLDGLAHSLALPRPDQTRSGGDGHYCFLDLPPGRYHLTATYTVPNHCHGATVAEVDVSASRRGLGFAQLDMALELESGAWPLAPLGGELVDDLTRQLTFTRSQA